MNGVRRRRLRSWPKGNRVCWCSADYCCCIILVKSNWAWLESWLMGLRRGQGLAASESGEVKVQADLQGPVCAPVCLLSVCLSGTRIGKRAHFIRGRPAGWELQVARESMGTHITSWTLRRRNFKSRGRVRFQVTTIFTSGKLEGVKHVELYSCHSRASCPTNFALLYVGLSPLLQAYESSRRIGLRHWKIYEIIITLVDLQCLPFISDVRGAYVCM